MRNFFYFIIGSIAFVALMFGLQYGGLINYKFFGPKYENARREVFENTQSYTEGKRQEASKMYFEAHSGGDKDLICSVIRTSFSNFDTTLLKNADVREFIDSCF